MEKASKTLPSVTIEADHAAKRVQTEAEAPKPAFSLGTLFPEFKGKSLFGATEASSALFGGGEVQSGLFGSFKPGTLFSKPAEEAQPDSEEEQGVVAEPTEDEAELLSRNPNPHVYTTFYTALARREVANFRVDLGDPLGPGAVTIEQSKEDHSLHQLVMRNKAKKILHSCLLLKGTHQTVRLKGKPGLSLFGYVAREGAQPEAKTAVAGEEKAPTESGKADGEPVEGEKEENRLPGESLKVQKEGAKGEEKPASTEQKPKEEKPASTEDKAKEEKATSSEEAAKQEKSAETQENEAKSQWKRENVKILFLSATDADDFLAELSKLNS